MPHVQSPKTPLVRSYLRVQNGQGRVIFPTWSSSRTSDNNSDFIFLYSGAFLPISMYWSYKMPSRDPNFHDMQPRFTLVQIFRRIRAYLSFHIYLSGILHFSFLMHVTSKRGPYSFM